MSEKKILKLGIVKPCQANFIIKNLLGDEAASSNECQNMYLIVCLHIAIEPEKICLWIYVVTMEGKQNSRSFGK